MAGFNAHPTPNPNSLKFTRHAGVFISAGMASYASAADAAGTPWAEQLFAIGGIANVFVMPQFLTVTKTTDADWDDLFERIEGVLAAHFEEAGG
ncbi:MAG: NifU N-terminal domain-containing protein [Rhodothermales bacterium]